MEVVPDEIFENAVKFVRLNAGKFDTGVLLYLYPRYKQVTVGPCNTPKPGWFDFQGKSKWEAWKSLGDAKKEDCMREYVAKVTELYPCWRTELPAGDSSGDEGKKSSMGVAVSSMANPDDVIEDKDKTIYDWLKEDNCGEVTRLLPHHDVNAKDQEGLTLLHWACDRGLCSMTELLLKRSALINLTDNDGQTPLHYAVSCEHAPVIELLLRHGAEKDVTDMEGLTPAQYTNNKQILELLDT